MPYTLNGVGTGYYGRKNLFSRARICEHCGEYCRLMSYDCTRCFCVVYIPVIPFNRLHIIDECPRCTRHVAVPLKQWQDAIEKDVGGAAQALTENPNDPAAAIRFILAAATYDVPDRLAATLPVMGRKLQSDKDVLTALGDAYLRLEMFAQADAAYHAANAIASTPALLRGMARCALHQKQPDRARPHINALIEQGESSAVTLSNWLVEQYQATARHADALELLQAVAEAFPDQATNPTHRAYVDASTAGLRTGKPISREGGLRRSQVGRILAAAAVLIVAGVAVVALLSMFVAANRPLWVVNGTSEQFTVAIGSKSAVVLPHSYAKVSAGEGEHTVKIDGPHIHQTHKVRMSTSFFGRAFDDDMFLLNPDGLAMLVHEIATYRKVAPTAPTVRYLLGDHLQHLTGITHPFQPLPTTVSVRNTSEARRQRVDLLSLTNQNQLLALAMREISEASAIAAARRGILVDPSDEAYLQFLRLRLPRQELLKLMEPLLAERPVVVHAHRFYQDANNTPQGEQAVAEKYAAMLATAPDDPGLLYLAGRSSLDRNRAAELFEAATKATKPEPMAFRALAMHRAADGDFAAVRDIASRARAAGIEEPQLRTLHIDALLALGLADQARPMVVDPGNPREPAPGLFFDWVKVMVMLGKAEEAAEVIKLATEGADYTDEERKGLRLTITRLLYQSGMPAGNLANEVAIIAAEDAKELTDADGSEKPGSPVNTAAADAPEELAEAMRGTDAMVQLTSALRAAASDDTAKFKASANRWVEQLATADESSRRLAKCIQDPEQALDAVRRSRLGIESMAAQYVVLGKMHPEIRERAFERAARLNVLPSPTYLLVKSILDKAKRSDTPAGKLPETSPKPKP